MLVDSQGTGANRKSDTNLDTLIMYISLQLATVRALNIKSYLTSNDMLNLKVSCLLNSYHLRMALHQVLAVVKNCKQLYIAPM